MITDSRSTRVRFTTTKRESENEIHHRTFRSLLISISPPASKRAYFTLLLLIFADSSSNDGGGQAKRPRPPRSRASGTRRCGRVFGTAIARVLKIPVTTPIDPPPTAPVLIQTPLSLSLCVCNSTAKLCKHIGTRTIFEKIFSKSLENPSSSPVFFFFFPLPHQRRTTTELDLSDYCVRLLNARIIGQSVFWGERFGDAAPEIGKWGWLVVRQAASVYARFGELNTVRGK